MWEGMGGWRVSGYVRVCEDVGGYGRVEGESVCEDVGEWRVSGYDG